MTEETTEEMAIEAMASVETIEIGDMEAIEIEVMEVIEIEDMVETDITGKIKNNFPMLRFTI